MIIFQKQICIVLVICLTFPLLTGCWNRKELNHIAIQLATAIDMVGDEYQVATQVVIPGEVSKYESSNNLSPVTLFHAQAPTILEAFRKLTVRSPGKIYSAHIRLVIIGESLAKQGISEVLDIFNRNPETRKDFFIAISKKSDAMDVLEVITSLERIPADNFYHMIETSRKNWTISNAATIDELIEELVSEGVNPVLPVLKLYGSLDEGKI
ncbi:Ger(x)C family spore germination protein [Paenibacillus sp. CAU 1782]